MKRIILSIACICCFSAFVTAQTTELNKVNSLVETNNKKLLTTTNKDTVAWLHGGILNVGFNEGFLHNWSAGGELASMTVNSIFSGHLDRLMHRQIWSNNLDLTYGLNYAYSQGFKPHKTDDRIDFTSKYGVKIDSSKNMYFTGIFNFKSQFTKGYDYTLPNWDSISNSKFMSPAYLTLALGAEYRAGTDVSFFLSPIAGRLTLANRFYTSLSPQGAFGIDSGKTAKYEFGAYFTGRYVWKIKKDMVFKTRLDLYSNYLAKDVKNSQGEVVRQDNPGNITVLFDNLLSWKVSKFLNLTFGATFMYDNSIPYLSTYTNSQGQTEQKNLPGNNLGWLQIKQIFTLGFEYKFN